MGDLLSVQNMAILNAAIKTYHRDSHHRTIEQPRTVAPRHEDVSCRLNCFQNFPIDASPYRLSCEEANAQTPLLPEDSARLLEPIGYEVSRSWNTALIKRLQCIDVRSWQLAPQPISAEKRRVADDEVGFGPCWFVRIALSVEADNGITVFDIGQLFEDRLAVFDHAVLMLPLKETDPDHNRSKFVGIKLGFDAIELLG